MIPEALKQELKRQCHALGGRFFETEDAMEVGCVVGAPKDFELTRVSLFKTGRDEYWIFAAKEWHCTVLFKASNVGIESVKHGFRIETDRGTLELWRTKGGTIQVDFRAG